MTKLKLETSNNTPFNKGKFTKTKLYNSLTRLVNFISIIIAIFSIFFILTQISNFEERKNLIIYFEPIINILTVFFTLVILRQIKTEDRPFQLIILTLELLGILILNSTHTDYDKVAWALFGFFVFILIIANNWMHLSYSRFTLSQMIISSFLLAIVLGTLLLYLPMSTKNGHITLTDAAFMATSAICVTGLSVIDISKEFTFYGQTVLLLLIQIGGLGIMSISAILVLFLRAKSSVTNRVRNFELFETQNRSDIRSTIIIILTATFIIELLGAIILFTQLEYTNLETRIFSAIFHSISSFCNAGFSLYTDSFHRYFNNPILVITVSLLIILGGIGYKVILTIVRVTIAKFFPIYANNKYGKIRINAQTHIVLLTSITLIIVGTLFILYSEYNSSFAHLTLKDKILTSLFQSVSTRTAGFETVPIYLLNPITIAFIMFLMFIGASPGGTGGGIKTTTFFVFLASVITAVKNEKHIIISKRKIPNILVNKSVAIVTLATTIWFTSALAIFNIEKTTPMMGIMFETVSAMSTVGLSLGITADLSTISKHIIMLLMLIGRVGYLTFFMSIGDIKGNKEYSMIEYPTENVTIG